MNNSNNFSKNNYRSNLTKIKNTFKIKIKKNIDSYKFRVPCSYKMAGVKIPDAKLIQKLNHELDFTEKSKLVNDIYYQKGFLSNSLTLIKHLDSDLTEQLDLICENREKLRDIRVLFVFTNLAVVSSTCIGLDITSTPLGDVEFLSEIVEHLSLCRSIVKGSSLVSRNICSHNFTQNNDYISPIRPSLKTDENQDSSINSWANNFLRNGEE